MGESDGINLPKTLEGKFTFKINDIIYDVLEKLGPTALSNLQAKKNIELVIKEVIHEGNGFIYSALIKYVTIKSQYSK